MKEILVKIYRKVLPFKLRVKLKNNFWYRWRLGGRVHTGEFVNLGKKNKDKSIIVFRLFEPGYGVLTAWRGAVAYIMWAEEMGYVPYIDHERASVYEKNEIGNENFYEHYFQQYSDLKPEEILHSRRVMFLPCETVKVDYSLTIRDEYDSDYYANFKKEHIIGKAWFNNNTIKWLEETADEILPLHTNILGVSMREEFRLLTEAGWSRSKNHPHEPSIDIILNKARELMVQWECEFIFLSTMYLDTIESFEKAFPNKILYVPRKRYYIDSEYRNFIAKSAANTYSPIGFEKELSVSKFNSMDYETKDAYIKEVYLLSKCTHLLATKNGGSVTAMYWNGGKYENSYFFEDLNSSSAY